jgi:hypothetical protein
MYCIFCYQNFIIGINPRTQARKRMIFYYKTNGITIFLKHVDAYHSFIAQMFEKQMNNLLRSIKERQTLKKYESI